MVIKDASELSPATLFAGLRPGTFDLLSPASHTTKLSAVCISINLKCHSRIRRSFCESSITRHLYCDMLGISVAGMRGPVRPMRAVRGICCYQKAKDESDGFAGMWIQNLISREQGSMRG